MPLLRGPLLTGGTTLTGGVDSQIDLEPGLVLRVNRGEGILSTASEVRRVREIPHAQNERGMGTFRTKTMGYRSTPVWSLVWRTPRPVIQDAILDHYEDHVGSVFPLLAKFGDDPLTAPWVQYMAPPNVSQLNARRASITLELGEIPRSMVTPPE